MRCRMVSTLYVSKACTQVVDCSTRTDFERECSSRKVSVCIDFIAMRYVDTQSGYTYLHGEMCCLGSIAGKV